MHNVACEFARAVVRSKDAQKQLARTSLISYLKMYLQIAEMSGNKHIGYFYEKENFMADTILKLR